MSSSNSSEPQSPLVRVNHLVKEFPIQGTGFLPTRARVHAVGGVSFEIRKGETLGLVGESGCGKSTLGRCLLRLIEPTSGQIFFKGQEITHLPPSQMRKLRRKIQMIFQDPYGSLNPRMKVEDLLLEPLQIHGLGGGSTERRQRMVHLLDLCGLRKEALTRYPHEFSGGQRQRISIARALAVEPELIVCDEPVSALDVSIQAQIINLLQDLQMELGLTYLFIGHDLNVVEHISTHVGVMYLGKIVEMGPTQAIFHQPKHPYSKALLSAIPVADPELKKTRILLKGDVPSPAEPPRGCSFHPRCPLAQSTCSVQSPQLETVGEGAHQVSCHYWDRSFQEGSLSP
ncbi:MAG: ABC transporter ATP-binding protein [Bdellovibrionia bacterium]